MQDLLCDSCCPMLVNHPLASAVVEFHFVHFLPCLGLVAGIPDGKRDHVEEHLLKKGGVRGQVAFHELAHYWKDHGHKDDAKVRRLEQPVFKAIVVNY